MQTIRRVLGQSGVQAPEKVVTTVSTTVIGLYIAGALVAIAFILEVATHFAPGQSVPRRSTYAIIGGSLWPILLLGLIELASVMAFTKRVRHSAVENHHRLVNR